MTYNILTFSQFMKHQDELNHLKHKLKSPLTTDERNAWHNSWAWLSYDNFDYIQQPNGLLNNLVSYYKMDTNGSFPDAHGTNNGTINWATYTASGKINWGYSFDGVNDWVDTNFAPDFLNPYTIAWYFKTSAS